MAKKKLGILRLLKKKKVISEKPKEEEVVQKVEEKKEEPAKEKVVEKIVYAEPQAQGVRLRQRVYQETKEGVPLFGDFKPSEETAIILEKKTRSKELIQKLQQINETYPLITLKIAGRDITFAWANIKWNDEIHDLMYLIFEPPLQPEERKILDEARRLLQEKLNIDFRKIRLEQAFNFLIDKFQQILKMLGYKLDYKQIIKMEYYIYRDFVGLGPIEPFMHDPNIEDISCDGFNIPIFIYHRNPLYGEMQTNIIFPTKEDVDSFVLRLAQKCGRSLSIAEPLLDGALPEGSRVQATYGTDIAMRGSNFTIRKFTKEPLSPVDLMNYGTANAEVFAYLWLIIENKLSILICGPTATGKTSFLNALSLFIKPEFKIISIEDTPELRLPHPNWVPEVARAGFSKGEYGEVTMFDLLKASLRQRPDYVMVGEVRGKEAYVMFQGMATGHPGMGTLHADSVSAVIDRLTTKPIDIPKAMLDNLDIICFIVLTKREGIYIRRVSEIVEIIGYDYESETIKTTKPWNWNPISDTFDSKNSIILEKICEMRGLSLDVIRQDLSHRIEILKWLQDNNIRNYKEVAKYFRLYYTNPAYLLKIIRQGGRIKPGIGETNA